MKIFIKIFLILFLTIFISQNLFAKNNHSNCSENKYKLCCTGKKVLFKSFRCKNYVCPPKKGGIPGLLAKPAIYLYPNGNMPVGEGIGYKPAVYLYTQKPLKVHITMDKSVLITYDAPKYVSNKGWNVLAYPDGKIKDLQPQFTNCNKFNDKKFGLEYAKKACETNDYPYVFWEGKMTKKPIPDSKEGWIVETKNLQSFFNNKLNYIGFNKAEKDEFIRYWTKVLSEKTNKTYFIYFLQTKEVNELAPMQVTPRPLSTNRIYMVAKPLNKNLPKKPQTQKLEKFKRKGFTLVEWGGTVL